MKELQLLLLILKSEENLEIPGVLELLLLVEAKNLIELSGSSTYSEELKKIILSLGKMFTDKVATKINCEFLTKKAHKMMGNFATASRLESDPFPSSRSGGVHRGPLGPLSQNRPRPSGWELESQIWGPPPSLNR